MKKSLILGIILCCTNVVIADNAKELVVASPNGKQVVKFRQIVQKNDAKQLVYSVSYDGKTVLRESQAGLQLDNKVWEHALAKKIIQPECWMDNFEVDSVSYSSLNETWKPVVGERSIVRNNYNAGTMYLSKKMVQNIV